MKGKKLDGVPAPPLSSNGRGEWWVPRPQLPPASGAGLAAALGLRVVVGAEAVGGSGARGGRGAAGYHCAGGEGPSLGRPSAVAGSEDEGGGCLGRSVLLPEASLRGRRETGVRVSPRGPLAQVSRLAAFGKGTRGLSY